MALINAEDAAKRLARVILSDIELYSRERPRAGETLESQIEEGRKLFGTRVVPALVPLFAAVLADRTAAKEGAVAAAPPSLAGASEARPQKPWSPAPAKVARVSPGEGQGPADVTPRPRAPEVEAPVAPGRPTPVVRAAAGSATPEPTIARPATKDGPGRRTLVSVSGSDDQPTPAPSSTAAVDQTLDLRPMPSPRPRDIVAPVELAREPARPAYLSTKLHGSSTPPARFTREPPGRSLIESAPDAPVPVLTSRISIPRLLAGAVLGGSAIALLLHFLG